MELLPTAMVTRRNCLKGAVVGVAGALVTGRLSTADAATTRAGVPRNLGTTTAATSATVTWQPPAQTGGTRVTGYRLARDGVDSTGYGAYTTTVAASLRSFTFTELVPGRTYNLSVAAVNARGAGVAASMPATVPTTSTPPTPPTPPGGGATPLFAEDFSTFDTALWYQNLPYFGSGAKDPAGSSYNSFNGENGTMTPFTIISDKTATNGSALRITCRKTTSSEQTYIHSKGVTGQSALWVGGATTSKTQFQFGQGSYADSIYIEYRARIPNQGVGMFPALWCNDANTLPYPSASRNPQIQQGAEIDMLEIFGTPQGGPGYFWSTSVWYKNSANQSPRSAVNAGRPTTDTTGWHTYGIEWTPTTLRFYQDGTPTGAADTHAAYFNGAWMDMRLNYTMQSNPNSTTPSSLYMDVDYVHTFRSRADAATSPLVAF